MARRCSIDAGTTVEKSCWIFDIIPSIEICRMNGSIEDCIQSETWIDFNWLVFYFRITIERDWL